MNRLMTATGANGYIPGLIAGRRRGHALDRAFYADPLVYARDVERIVMRD